MLEVTFRGRFDSHLPPSYPVEPVCLGSCRYVQERPLRFRTYHPEQFSNRFTLLSGSGLSVDTWSGTHIGMTYQFLLDFDVCAQLPQHAVKHVAEMVSANSVLAGHLQAGQWLFENPRRGKPWRACQDGCTLIDVDRVGVGTGVYSLGAPR